MKTTYKEAQAIILSKVKPVGTEILTLEKAQNRILAQDVLSSIDLPSRNTSAMDGFALIASCSENTPVSLRIAGEAAAGCESAPPVNPREAILVTTGGPIPPGADAVVKVEEVESGQETILLKRRVKKNALINFQGQEIKKGETLLKRGTVLDYRKTALLASVGAYQVEVFRQPGVALMSTGNEILEPFQPFSPEKAYNCNRYILSGLLKREGFPVHYSGICPDHVEDLEERLHSILDSFPIVITTGSVSKGKYDYLRSVLKKLGVKIHITSTNIKPGRPLVFGTRNGTLFFGIPGYPSAALINAFVFLCPALKKMKGLKKYLPHTITAVAAESFKSRKDKVYFIRIDLKQKGWRLYAHSAGSQLTANYRTSALCRGFAVLPEDVERVRKGQDIEIILCDVPF